MTWTVTATAQPSNVPPRVSVTVTTTDGTASCTVVQNNADGSQSATRTNTGSVLQLPGGTGQFYVYEMWLGQATTFTVLEGNVTSSPVTVTASAPWLIVPGLPALSRAVDFRTDSFGELTYDIAAGVSEVSGSQEPVVVTDGTRKSAAGQFTVAADTPTALADVLALLNLGQSLLLNVPPSLGLAVPAVYIACGHVSVKRRTNVGTDPYRDVVIPYRVVRQPIGGYVSQKGYADLIATYANYAAIAALPSYSSLL